MSAEQPPTFDVLAAEVIQPEKDITSNGLTYFSLRKALSLFRYSMRSLVNLNVSDSTRTLGVTLGSSTRSPDADVPWMMVLEGAAIGVGV